ncbi:hypothetical protein LTR93_011608 [Exophiala xenobiotica]|nr:hypothetical protein LTR93_011608 [Exophiala xenobiotica]
MSLPSGLSIEYLLPNGQAVSSHEVDAWELKASRRALRNLRTLLEGQPMMDLIQKQIEEADTYYKNLIVESKGQYKESRIDLHATGITIGQFMQWRKEWMEDLMTEEGRRDFYLNTMVPAHPEHYAVPPYPVGIIETIGEHIVRVRLHNDFPVPDFVLKYGDPSYANVPLVGSLDDGSVLFYVFQEFRDSGDGCDLILRLLFPAAAPEILFSEHAEHLAIEFRSFFIRAVRRSQSKSS